MDNGDGNAKSSATYIPISRGIEPYLGAFSPWAITLYLQLALRADWRAGPSHGTVLVSIGPHQKLTEIEQRTTLGVCPNLSEKLGWHRNTIRIYLKELSRGHPVGILTKNKGTAPPFIEIISKIGRTRGRILKVRICKAKLSASQFHGKLLPRAGARARRDDQIDPKQEAQGLLDELVGRVSETLRVEY